MNIRERETLIQLLLSAFVVFCCFLGISLMISMSRREDELLDYARSVTTLSQQQARTLTEYGRFKDDVTRRLDDELSEVQKDRNVLRKIAEQLHIPSDLPPK